MSRVLLSVLLQEEMTDARAAVMSGHVARLKAWLCKACSCPAFDMGNGIACSVWSVWKIEDMLSSSPRGS